MGFSHLPELLIILVIALIFFGPRRLPEVGSAIGKGLREFRRATSEIEDAVLHHDQTDDLDDEDEFPHVPPEPAADSGKEVTASVDTLAMRRERRQAGAIHEAEPENESQLPS